MNEQMKILINLLKERIGHNLQVIRKNEEIIRMILTQPVSNERSEQLKENFSINRKLLEENQDSLNIELQLINYLGKFKEVLKHQANNKKSSGDVNNDIDSSAREKYLNDDDPEEFENNDADDDLLNLTIRGDISFNTDHPRFDDEEFFENLIEYYKEVENYEMCSHLLKIKGRK
jgi:hypothetical protein